MTGSKKILINLFTYSGASLASKGLAIFYTIYILKILGPAGNGAIGFSKGFVQYFLLFVQLGYDQVGVIELAKNRENHQKYVFSILLVRIISGFVFYCLMIIGIYFFNWKFNLSELKIYLILIQGLNIFAVAISLQWVFQAYEKMGVIAVRTIILNVLIFAGLLFFVRNDQDTVLAITVMTIANILNTLWILIYYLNQYGKIQFDWDFPLIKSIVKSSYVIGFIWVIMTIYQTLNVTILGTIKTDAETGIYSAAYSVVLLSVLPSAILQESFFPRLSQKILLSDRIAIMEKFAILNHMAGVIISMSFYFYHDLLIKLIGVKYSQSGEILKYFSLIILMIFLSTTYFPALLAWKKEKRTIFAHITGLIVCAILSFGLIPKYGIYGAVFSLIATEIAVAMVLMYLYWHETKATHLKSFFQILAIGIVSFGSISLFKDFSPNIILSYAMCIVLFFTLIFLFKIIEIDEIKRILKQ